MRSTAAKRFLCGKGFEKIIEDVSYLGLEDLENHLGNTKLSDLEIRSKFELLGLMEDKVTKEMQQLVDHEIVPDFTRIARTFEVG